MAEAVEEVEVTEVATEMLGRDPDGQSHINMLIYGRSGAGKTYRAATAPGCYILAFDPRGHDSIPYAVPGKVIHTLSDLLERIEWIEAGGHLELAEKLGREIKTVVVDGLNFLHDMFLTETGEYMVSSMGAKDPDLMPIAGRTKILRSYQRVLQRMINLTQTIPEENRVHVIFTCLEEHLKEDETAPFRIRPLFGTQSMNNVYPAMFSVIGYITPVGEDENGNLTQDRRMLFTEYRGILARDRLGVFPLMGEAPNLSEYLK